MFKKKLILRELKCSMVWGVTFLTILTAFLCISLFVYDITSSIEEYMAQPKKNDPRYKARLHLTRKKTLKKPRKNKLNNKMVLTSEPKMMHINQNVCKFQDRCQVKQRPSKQR